MIPPPAPPARAAIVLGALAFLLYCLTSPPGITWRHLGEDGAEFAAVGRVFGVTHPTGYPLFTLFLTLVSTGASETAWRCTLLSNFFGAIGVVLATLVFFEIARRLLPDRDGSSGWTTAHAAALLAGVVWAASPLWWSQAIIIEVYALHLVFITLALWLTLRFRGERSLLLLGWVAGLAMTHHLQFALAAPSLLILLACFRGRVSWKSLAAGAALAAVPLSLYLVLFLRSRFDPALDWGDPDSWSQLFWVIRGEQYRFRMFTSPPREVLERAQDFLGSKFMPQFGWAMFPLALPGVVALGRRSPRLLVAIVLYAVLQFVFTVNYAIPDPDAYFLPVVLAWTALIAAGIAAILSIAHSVRARIAVLALLALAIGAAIPGRWQLLSLTGDTVAEDYAREIMGSVPEKSLILADGDGRTFSLWYRRLVDGRGDVTVVYRSLLVWPWYRRNVAERDTTFRLTVEDRPLAEMSRHVFTDNWTRRPVYCTFVDAWVARNFRVQPEGHIFKVLGLRRDVRPPEGPVVWKPIDITASANADYRFDPFTPGSRDSSGLFPGLGGGAIYWGTLPLMVARPQSVTGRPSVFTTVTLPRAGAEFPMHPEPTRMICLLMDGGGIGRASLRLGEARVHYTEGPPETVEIRSYENVWDYAAESFELALPEAVVAWYGPKNQSLTVLPIPTDPERIPERLELTGEGPPGETGVAAGYTLFAVSQVLVRLQGGGAGSGDPGVTPPDAQRQSPAATKAPQ